MQLMPLTAQSLGADASDPAQNVDAGARYLRDLLLKYDGLLWHALAAYNAGPEALEKYHNQIPPYAKTILYIEKIDRDLKRSAGASNSRASFISGSEILFWTLSAACKACSTSRAQSHD